MCPEPSMLTYSSFFFRAAEPTRSCAKKKSGVSLDGILAKRQNRQGLPEGTNCVETIKRRSLFQRKRHSENRKSAPAPSR